MEIIVYVLYSNGNSVKTDNYYKLILQKKIGEGTYGHVYLINKDLVVKIFKNYSQLSNNNETKLLPNKTENREVNFFINYLNSNYKNNNQIININAIGIIKYINDDNFNIINNYCLILPNCTPITKLISQWKMPLIRNQDGKEIVIKFMKRLIDIELFLNRKFNSTNIDIKLNNYMIEKRYALTIDNILAIDFGLIIKNSNNRYDFKKKYYIWPQGNNINITYIPAYSICINGLILFLGEYKVKTRLMEENLKQLKEDKDFYNIFNESFKLKLDCENLNKLVVDYMKKYKFKR